MKKECLKCGWEWESRVEYPRMCPRCKSYSFHIRTKVEASRPIKTKAESPNAYEKEVLE